MLCGSLNRGHPTDAAANGLHHLLTCNGSVIDSQLRPFGSYSYVHAGVCPCTVYSGTYPGIWMFDGMQAALQDRIYYIGNDVHVSGGGGRNYGR